MVSEYINMLFCITKISVILRGIRFGPVFRGDTVSRIRYGESSQTITPKTEFYLTCFELNLVFSQ